MTNILDYGFTPEMMPEGASGVPARVTAVYKDRYEIISEYGTGSAKLKHGVYRTGAESLPTTGDFILIHYNGAGDSMIIKTLKRRSKFARNDFSGHKAEYVKTVLEQLVAANFDYVFIMASLNHDFNLRRIERYLTLAWQSGGIPVVVLTKSDLVEDYSEQINETKKIASGANVCAVSAKTGFGIETLSQYLKPRKSIVFLGSSGVGKSSLVNALAGEEIMDVNVTRDVDASKGRHTTTHRQLLMLPNGVMIIDTPGMRELGMWDVSTGLGEAFADVERHLGSCKFSDCKHGTEPGCAVKAAIKNGELPAGRWESYLLIKQEARFADNRSASQRTKKERGKALAMQSSQKKGKDGTGYENY